MRRLVLLLASLYSLFVQARAQGMEGAEPQAFHRPAEDGAHAFPHFPRRLVGEGHRQHLARPGAATQQDMGEPGGQHPRLAGAGTGEHQQRSVDGFHRGALFAVQAGQILGHGAGAIRGDMGWI